MPPTKVLIEQQQQQQQQLTKIQQKTITTKTVDKVLTRSQAWHFPTRVTAKDMSKRKADQLSPPKGKTTKRQLYDRGTNTTNVPNKPNTVTEKKTTQKKLVATIKHKDVKVTTVVQPKIPVYIDHKASKGAPNKENVDPSVKKQTKVVVHLESNEKNSETKYDCVQKVLSSGKNVTKFRRSLESNQDKVDESFYTTALEEVPQESDESSRIISPIKRSNEKKNKKSEERKKENTSPKVPPGVEDFDKENMLDPAQVSEYAMDIFKYMKRREKCFTVQDYMPRQVVITKWMRAVLVDWMVDVQENFELNHETLYLGVKITDIYLNKVVVAKEILQLIGATALFLSAKYEERMPPLIEDFIYICENAFTREDMIKMEMNVFKVINFCLGIPLSYRFLRRFARCCKATMPTLTLARYILELSLMEYHMIFFSESKIACATLYMALRMNNVSGWTSTLEYYSGYSLSEFMPIVLDLNAMLHRKPKEQLKIIRNKYSHKIFFEVAQTPLLTDEELKCETFSENKENESNV